ncbi:MAG: 3-phosphoshikimate 1-carboxyvinyltransferase [Sutterellaceae bacterium]|nr:3-phosphoshikimate 1-carboxyvinyltransferase [Burkholderiaceae bacterium]MCX7901215.1 3-phosphoshikimate 1-carboxyvinyltransferase [Burkholderiaceae bacterium]MDW8430809.1 3-phosphoshikimate 1-carboxyvinyltransferase [Sutterellaceae bacterium]
MNAAPPFPPELTVAPITRAAGVVRLPGSKSISNRALLLAALADGQTTLTGLLDAEDTRVMIEALRSLGVRVHTDGDAARVAGCGGVFPQRRAELFLGNAGTAMRSLTAALAFAGGHYRLDGVARMRERPIGDLVEALNRVGARIRYEGRSGYPPLAIEPAPAPDTDTIEVKGEVSSQFVSGILMAAPAFASAAGLRVRVPGALISQPYVTMTVALMQRFGVQVKRTGAQEFIVPRARYRTPGCLAVEGDASAASYFLALGAIAGGPVRVTGVGRGSLQGDIAFADLLAAMGARIVWGEDFIEAAAAPLAGIEYDCTAIPDAAMTAAIVALFARGRTRLCGIGSWRVKETDRIAAMAAELAKLGAPVRHGADWLAIEGPVAVRAATIDTYDDHRIAMCFALAAAGGVPMRIRAPGCVAKTFPRYFEVLSTVLCR